MSAWMADPWGGTRSIGFYDATHTSATGLHSSEVVEFTRSGYAAGHSLRFVDTMGRPGRTAWVAGPDRVTRRVGLFYEGAEPTLPGGWPENTIVDVNDAGQSAGFVEASTGSFAWQANADGRTRLIGPVYQAPGPSGVDHVPVAINPSGTVIGNSTTGPNSLAWVQRKNGGVVVEIGMRSEDYVGEDGATINQAVAINDRGHVIGSVRRGTPAFPGTYAFEPWVWTPTRGMISLDLGNQTGGAAYLLTNSGLVGGAELAVSMFSLARAWVYDIETGERRFVGLTGDEGPPDYLIALTESGVAIGRSTPYRQDLCWMAVPGKPTTLIGFYEYEYYLGPGRHSYVVAVAGSGLTIGTSDIVANGGKSAWLASPVDASTLHLGLLDGTYTGGSRSGYDLKTSAPTHVTGSGFVAGYSVRYHGDFTEEGQTAWVYNSVADRYAKLVLSVRPSDGYAHSEVHVLLENGIALGSYTRFAEDGADLGERAFVWVTGRGAYDLASVLDVDPEVVGWDHLAGGIVVNEDGVMAGHGVPRGTASQGVYLARLD